MRLPLLLFAAFAASAAAQETPPPADPAPAPGTAAPAPTGLSDLTQTVNGLQDAQPPADPADSAPAPDASPPPAQEPAPAPADAPPEAQTEPPAPAVTEAPPPAQTEAAAPAQAEPEAAPPTEAPATPAPPEAHAPILPTYLRHPGADLDPEQVAQIAHTVARGQVMVAVARAGLVASQDMLSHIPDPDAAGIAGWIAEPQGNAMMVTFYDAAEGGPKAVYRVNVLAARAVSREAFLTAAERPALTPLEARLAAARAATDGLDHHPCTGQDFNVLVIPPDAADAPIDVYQMSPAAQRGHFPLGGHFRSRVEGDGHVAEVQSYGACVNLVPGDTAPGTMPAPVPATGPDDQLPSEIHVFLAAWTGHPLIVSSGGRRWRVTPDAITETP